MIGLLSIKIVNLSTYNPLSCKQPQIGKIKPFPSSYIFNDLSE